MYDQVRQVRYRLYRWLYGAAIGLAVLAVPHAMAVMSQRLPSAAFTLHAVAIAVLWVSAEFRRLEWRREQACEGLSELVTAVEER